MGTGPAAARPVLGTVGSVAQGHLSLSERGFLFQGLRWPVSGRKLMCLSQVSSDQAEPRQKTLKAAQGTRLWAFWRSWAPRGSGGSDVRELR